VTENPAVLAAAASLGATPAQVGLAWLLAHYSNALLIPGTANPAHLAENLAAGSICLNPDTIAALDHLAASELQTPGKPSAAWPSRISD
jgi:pyridoxine 4-dehydrogenase